MARLHTNDLFWSLAVLCITAVLFSGIGDSGSTTPPPDALRSCMSNLKNIGTALEMYSTDGSGRFPHHTIGGLRRLVPNYLKQIPTCPAAEGDTYTAPFRSSSNPDAYTLICCGNHHANAGCPPNHPQYTSTMGLITR